MCLPVCRWFIHFNLINASRWHLASRATQPSTLLRKTMTWRSHDTTRHDEPQMRERDRPRRTRHIFTRWDYLLAVTTLVVSHCSNCLFLGRCIVLLSLHFVCRLVVSLSRFLLLSISSITSCVVFLLPLFVQYNCCLFSLNTTDWPNRHSTEHIYSIDHWANHHYYHHYNDDANDHNTLPLSFASYRQRPRRRWVTGDRFECDCCCFTGGGGANFKSSTTTTVQQANRLAGQSQWGKVTEKSTNQPSN